MSKIEFELPSKKSSDNIINNKREKCEKMYQGFHKKFPSVETLTSTEYLQHLQQLQLQLRLEINLSTRNSNEDDTMNNIPQYTLVDVRSKPEQQVSMIPNAITLDQFEANLNANRNDKHASPSEKEVHVVVTYCTIGYRSGLEAQRLRDQYNLNVRNLDGIVGYTHACTALTAIKVNSDANTDANANADAKVNVDVDYNLIDPKTKEATKKVHVFGSAWDVASDDFQTLWFSKFDMALRGIGVGFKAFLGGVRSFFQNCRSSCSSTDAVVR